MHGCPASMVDMKAKSIYVEYDGLNFHQYINWLNLIAYTTFCGDFLFVFVVLPRPGVVALSCNVYRLLLPRILLKIQQKNKAK